MSMYYCKGCKARGPNAGNRMWDMLQELYLLHNACRFVQESKYFYIQAEGVNEQLEFLERHRLHPVVIVDEHGQREVPVVLTHADLTAADWRRMSKSARTMWTAYWRAKGIVSFHCTKCSFPTATGQSGCEACA